MAISFTKKLQARPKLKAVKRKIKANKAAGKVLSRKYTSLIKSEGRIVGRQMKKVSKKRKAVKRKKRR